MHDQTVSILKALADDTRIGIIRQLIENGELSTSDIAKSFTLSQPTLSHHLSLLMDTHLLNARKNGVSWVYSLNSEYFEKIGINIKKLVHAKHAH